MTIPAIYKHELRVCFEGRWFRIAIVVACLIAAIAAIEACYCCIQRHAVDPFYLSDRSVWANWILSDAGAGMCAFIFRMLIPLLAIMPFAWSLNSDRLNGYDAQILVRVSRRDRIISKLVSAFCSGAAVTAAALMLNFLILLPLLPANVARYEDWMIIGIFYDSPFAYWFYNYPIVYTILYTLLDMALMGCWASFAMACSVVFRNRINVVILPYVGLFGWHYLNSELALALDINLPSFNLIDDLDPTFFLVRSDWMAIGAQLLLLAACSLAGARILMRRDVR